MVARSTMPAWKTASFAFKFKFAFALALASASVATVLTCNKPVAFVLVQANTTARRSHHSSSSAQHHKHRIGHSQNKNNHNNDRSHRSILFRAIGSSKDKTSHNNAIATTAAAAAATTTTPSKPTTFQTTKQRAPPTTATPPRDGIYVNKPVLRGQFHKWGAILYPPLLGIPLCVKAWKVEQRIIAAAAAATTPQFHVDGVAASAAVPRLFRAALLFGFAVEFVFGISATLHTYPWKTDRAHQIARKVDFTAIFVGIACFYSSVGRLVLGLHSLWNPIEGIVWTCAMLGTLLKWRVPDCPHWCNAAIFLVQGWVSLPLVPVLLSAEHHSRRTSLSMVAGGLFVTLGAIAYSLQWPFDRTVPRREPFEIVFGPHEMFHVGTLFMAVALWYTMWTRITELSLQ